MGRITIFTKNDCHFCLLAKRELQYRCLPFTEISIALFPERRADMMALAGRLTVPQIFFNETLIGGSEALIQHLEIWDFVADNRTAAAAAAGIDKDENENKTNQGNTDNGNASSNSIEISLSGDADKDARRASISKDILKNSRIWRKYQEEVASQPDPTDPRLALPTPLVVGWDNSQRELAPMDNSTRDGLDDDGDVAEDYFGCIPLPDGTCAGIREVTNDLVEHMPRMKLAYLAKFYTDCFSGDKGVDALLKIYPFRRPHSTGGDEEARVKAVAFGRLLQQYGILHHVCDDHDFKDTGSYYYRLQPFHQPHVLNSFQSLQQVLEHLPEEQRLPKSFYSPATVMEKRDTATIPNKHPVVTPAGALELLVKLQKLLSSIEERATGRDGVDFLAAKNYDDLDYQQLEEGSCQLQCMDIIALASTMSDNEKMVFGIHLYNIMLRHAFIKVGIPVKPSERGSFFTGVCYNVANQILSLDDVEHGMIRANTRHPYHVKAQFVGDDPRRAWAVSKLDPRIHFTLFCGANSCPPINSYTVENLDAELQLAAEAFCLEDDNVIVEEETRTIHLSMIFYWYRSDFHCASNRELPGAVLEYLPKGGDKFVSLSRMIHRKSGSSNSLARLTGNTTKDIKVKFLPYDWGSKAAPGKCLEFHSGLLQNTKRSLLAPFSKSKPTHHPGCIPATKTKA